MLYLFKLLFLLINIDQDAGYQIIENDSDFSLLNIEQSTDLSLGTVGLLIEGLLNRLQDGLTIADIENSLFFILFVRFLILAVRYNSKTSFYITCIGLCAGYLWYRHLIDIISTYSYTLIKIPFLQSFGEDAINAKSLGRQSLVTYSKLEENIHWYQPGQVLYAGILRAIVHIDSETGQSYYIDPFSMIISKLQESGNSGITKFYYQLYKNIIPNVYDVCSKFWGQLSGVFAYATITRIGKRYCPYVIRWHWTFVLIITIIEPIFITFVNRAYYFQTAVLIPQREVFDNSINASLETQINFLTLIISSIVITHIGFLIFALFHAIWGQYFYLPFFVENTELHIGPRPSNSIYSGGNTSWQDPKQKETTFNRRIPKLWYGWFGRGTKSEWKISSQIRQFLNKMIKNFKKQFRR